MSYGISEIDICGKRFLVCSVCDKSSDVYKKKSQHSDCLLLNLNFVDNNST